MRYLERRIGPRTGRPYAPQTRRTVYGVVRGIFRSVYRHQLILTNPTRNLSYTTKEQKVHELMDSTDMNRFLDGIDIHSKYGLRDRAMFELMYSSGLRAGEVAHLMSEDVDYENRMIHIRLGKFGKDRIVPISQVACMLLKKYANNRAPNTPVFVGVNGQLSYVAINTRFKKRLSQQGMYRRGLTSHSIRRCTATSLLSEGADVRYVQELLGHESVQTTVGYTHELVENIKRIYRTHHPRENEWYREIDQGYEDNLSYLRRRIEQAKEKRQREVAALKMKNHGLNTRESVENGEQI
jgi:site-specific recombinase XerD